MEGGGAKGLGFTFEGFWGQVWVWGVRTYLAEPLMYECSYESLTVNVV